MVLWVVAVVIYGHPPNPVLVVYSTAVWVSAALLVLHRWWSGTGAGLSATDAPGRLLAAAVAALPQRGREWGMAMNAELTEVRGRSARGRFALSSVRAMLWLPAVVGCRLAGARARGRGGCGGGTGRRVLGRRDDARADRIHSQFPQVLRRTWWPG